LAREKGNNGFRYDNCVESSLVAGVEELYVVYHKSNITNNTIGVSSARVVLVERKGKFKVNLARFIVEVKGVEARGHKGQGGCKELGQKNGKCYYCNCITYISNQLRPPIAKAEEVNILTLSDKQSPCTPKTNSLSQLFKQFFSTHQYQALHIFFFFVGLAY
jgi:hypothetical protein